MLASAMLLLRVCDAECRLARLHVLTPPMFDSSQTTAAMISLSFVTVITGFYAMNLRNGPALPNGYQHNYTVFYKVGHRALASF
jgi:hypothetical protein